MRWGWLLMLFGSLLQTAGAAAESTEELFFERHVRPLLIEHCQDCHGPDLAESQLRLDSLEGLLRGGQRGPAIKPGDPDQSLLIRAVRHGEQVKMPRERKLPQQEIDRLAEWIKNGAVWPGQKPVIPARQPTDLEPEFTQAQRDFWAFQPPRQQPVPAVKNAGQVQSPLDAFILARLEQQGLSPAPPADRRTLIRRVTFDLIGLPPTAGEVDEFLADNSPDAFVGLVERLLNSPRYGERWGRHWLDVVRYADSNGLDENLAHANAFRYRDYVIDAFNADKSWQRFVQEQLAGDLLPADGNPGNELDKLTATGFLCIGPKMLAEDDPVKLQMDIIDEQVDTLSRAFMGLTMGCARCHDHKFDPLTAADYYALAGIFKSTQTMDTLTVVARWHERPLADPATLQARGKVEQAVAGIDQRINTLRQQARQELFLTARSHLGDYLLAADQQRRQRERLNSLKPVGDDPATTTRPEVILLEAEAFPRGNVLKDTANYGAGIGVLVNAGPTPNFVEYDIELAEAGTYRLEVRYAAAAARPCRLIVNGSLLSEQIADGVTGSWFPDSQRWEVETFVPLQTGKNVLRLEQPAVFPHIDKLLLVPEAAALHTPELLDQSFTPLPELVNRLAEWLEKLPKESPLQVWREATGQQNTSEFKALAGRLQEQAGEPESALANALNAEDSPLRLPPDHETYFPAEVRQQLEQQRTEAAELRKQLPQLPMAMAVADGTAEDLRIHFRGDHLTQGEVVPRRFPRILSQEAQPPIPSGDSGRLELAHWLTSPRHPLTARVIVNRVWHWHFGRGLVPSTDNFGELGDRPTHPELLDWLAVEFMRSGWSLKWLHRQILLSATWQQSSQSATAEEADPENKLFARWQPRRLEAEEVRDAILAISGQLDSAMRGSLLPTPNRAYVTSTANVNPDIYRSPRRSVYLPVVRSALYEVFQAFDFAEPSVINGNRQATTIAPQALFLMNSEFVTQQTEALSMQLLRDSPGDQERIEQLYRSILSRPVSDSERERALQFVHRYRAAFEQQFPDQREAGRQRAWESLCRALLSTNEFVFVE